MSHLETLARQGVTASIRQEIVVWLEPKGPETTPAEWATALLEKMRESEEKSEGDQSEPEPQKTQE